MNFLAHFYFAYDSSDRLIGQFIADAVKGKKYEQYAIGIQNGIRQHRIIDTQTDQLAPARELRSYLRIYCGVHAPIAVDMFFDHALALNWSTFHVNALEQFAHNVYSELGQFESQMPDRMKTTFEYMRRYDWLSAYQHKEGLIRSLKGLSQRVTGGEQLLGAFPVLDEATQLAKSLITPMMEALSAAVKEDIVQTTEPFLSKAHYY